MRPRIVLSMVFVVMFVAGSMSGVAVAQDGTTPTEEDSSSDFDLDNLDRDTVIAITKQDQSDITKEEYVAVVLYTEQNPLNLSDADKQAYDDFVEYGTEKWGSPATILEEYTGTPEPTATPTPTGTEEDEGGGSEFNSRTDVQPDAVESIDQRVGGIWILEVRWYNDLARMELDVRANADTYLTYITKQEDERNNPANHGYKAVSQGKSTIVIEDREKISAIKITSGGRRNTQTYTLKNPTSIFSNVIERSPTWNDVHWGVIVTVIALSVSVVVRYRERQDEKKNRRKSMFGGDNL